MNKYNKLNDTIVDDEKVIDILDVELDVTDDEKIVLNYFIKFETKGVENAINELIKKVDKIGGITSYLVEGQLEDAIAENEETVEIDINFIMEELYGICWRKISQIQ